METVTTIAPDDSISLFVKNIILLENPDKNSSHTLPFYADGYPGILFQETENGLLVLPQNKIMPDFFLFGQTIHPIQLKINGSYKLLVFQLYPFVIESFFGINPGILNDDCYDLLKLKMPGFDLAARISQLKALTDFSVRINNISEFLHSVFQFNKEKLDYQIQQAILQIIAAKGLQSIKTIRDTLSISERTFERRFLARVGVTPKQFSQIIRFQNSLSDLKSSDFNTLSDVVYKNGFADQSHFIRVFKAFTGSTPSSFKLNT